MTLNNYSKPAVADNAQTLTHRYNNNDFMHVRFSGIRNTKTWSKSFYNFPAIYFFILFGVYSAFNTVQVIS